MKPANAIRLVILFLIMTHAASIHAQSKRLNDFSLWTWFQAYKDINKKTYVSFQYQLRLSNNLSHFDASNYYFIFGANPYKNMNVELLYQINTNYQRDVHTFYVGYTYKVKVKRLSFYFRTAYQHTRNFFTGEFKYDQAVNEWRNRFKCSYLLTKNLEIAVSAEPTINLFNHQGFYIDKVRTVAQLTFNYNKYQSLNLFYIYQPDIYAKSVLENKFMLGVTYQLNLPSKLKKYKKIFKMNQDLKDVNSSRSNNIL